MSAVRHTGIGRAGRAGVCLFVLLACVAGAGCAAATHQQPRLIVRQWIIPVTMPHTDQLCVETTDALRPCVSVAEFRLWMLGQKAEEF